MNEAVIGEIQISEKREGIPLWQLKDLSLPHLQEDI
jgi:hypothetical protein